jgi:hypothetical protein
MAPRRLLSTCCGARGAGARPLLLCTCTCLFLAFIALPLCISTAWLLLNPSAARALSDLTAVLKPEVCPDDPAEACNSFDGVERLGEHFLRKTRHQPTFPATDFPWSKTLRRNFKVFRDEYVSYTREMRVPYQKELGESQVQLAGNVQWRTIPLRLSYADTDFAKHFPRSMALVRTSGVDAFSVYIHYMVRRGRPDEVISCSNNLTTTVSFVTVRRG